MSNAKHSDFEQLVLPHLNAAYNLARWMLGNQHDAEDAVQQAFLQSLKNFEQFKGGNCLAWLLKIVRNTCLNKLKTQSRHAKLNTSFDEYELVNSQASITESIQTNITPEETTIIDFNKRKLWQCINQLSIEHKEIIVMREIIGLEYKEIAKVADVPIGTVMSRLARARSELKNKLNLLITDEIKHGL